MNKQKRIGYGFTGLGLISILLIGVVINTAHLIDKGILKPIWHLWIFGFITYIVGAVLITCVIKGED